MSLVFPKTKLFISLRKSFSKSFLTFVLSFVFTSMDGLNYASWTQLTCVTSFVSIHGPMHAIRFLCVLISFSYRTDYIRLSDIFQSLFFWAWTVDVCNVCYSVHIWIPTSHRWLSRIQSQSYNLCIYLWSPSARLSSRLDSELGIDFMLLMNFTLYAITWPVLFSFLIGTESFMQFSVFSPKYSNYSTNFSANSVIVKL